MTGGPDLHVGLLDDARHAAAVADRSQRRVLRDIDEQDATLLGSLEGLAEAGAALVVHTAVGRRLRGTVRALAADHLVLTGPHGTAWLRTASITMLRVADGGPLQPGGGERATRPAVPLADALRASVERRDHLEVVFSGGDSVHGTALAAGRDLLTLRTSTGEQVLVHLARAALVLTTDA